MFDFGIVAWLYPIGLTVNALPALLIEAALTVLIRIVSGALAWI